MEEISENEEEMLEGEGLAESDEEEEEGVSSTFLLIGMLAEFGGGVKDAESADAGGTARFGATRFGSEFELALSLALRFENLSIDGVFFSGCLTTTESAAASLRSLSDLEFSELSEAVFCGELVGFDSDEGVGVGIGGSSAFIMTGCGRSVGMGVGVVGGGAVRSTGMLKSEEWMNCKK